MLLVFLPLFAYAADVTGQWNVHLIRFGDEFAAARVDLKAEGAKTAAILRAEGDSKAIETVFQAIHDGRPDQELLSYQYLQMLPQLAQGPANKIFVIPSEFTQALGNIGQAIQGRGGAGDGPPQPPRP